MDHLLIKRPADCSVLIVDDEIVICNVLKTALQGRYRIETASNGAEAFALLEKNDFDVVVTDLKLPDFTGLEVLTAAKSKDEYTEVIMITGYATVDSATTAVNMGVSAFLTKPLSIIDFVVQVEKAIASRLFHLKSFSLMQQSDYMEPVVKDHLHDLASLYYFTRKLMLSLEVSEIMRITLEEVNQRMGTTLAVVDVNLLGYSEVFAMPLQGEVEHDPVAGLIVRNVKQFPLLDEEKFLKGDLQLYIYKGKYGEAPSLENVALTAVPMIVTGRSIGTLALFHRSADTFDPDQNQFLYVFTSLISSVIEHGYMDMQAHHQAKTDSLTGIANHRLFHETLEREIARANRRHGIFSLILIDLDNFKNVNDTYGHQVGDGVLIDLTRRIGKIIRGGDVLARYGGEEFGLILPDTGAEGAAILAGRICKELAGSPFVYSQFEIPYTASLGLAVYDGNKATKKDDLIGEADKALYVSKRSGKNRVTVSEPGI